MRTGGQHIPIATARRRLPAGLTRRIAFRARAMSLSWLDRLMHIIFTLIVCAVSGESASKHGTWLLAIDYQSQLLGSVIRTGGPQMLSRYAVRSEWVLRGM